jgi:hypothetical protein
MTARRARVTERRDSASCKSGGGSTEYQASVGLSGLSVTSRGETGRDALGVGLPQETVLYALSAGDARRVLEQAAAAAGDGGGKVQPLEGGLADDEVLFRR